MSPVRAGTPPRLAEREWELSICPRTSAVRCRAPDSQLCGVEPSSPPACAARVLHWLGAESVALVSQICEISTALQNGLHGRRAGLTALQNGLHGRTGQHSIAGLHGRTGQHSIAQKIIYLCANHAVQKGDLLRFFWQKQSQCAKSNGPKLRGSRSVQRILANRELRCRGIAKQRNLGRVGAVAPYFRFTHAHPRGAYSCAYSRNLLWLP